MIAGETVMAADGPDQRGVTLDKRVPGLLVRTDRYGRRPRPINRQTTPRGVDQVTHTNERLSRCVIIAGCGYRAALPICTEVGARGIHSRPGPIRVFGGVPVRVAWT